MVHVTVFSGMGMGGVSGAGLSFFSLLGVSLWTDMKLAGQKKKEN